MSDDDRPRKSWREIDQNKDKSKHRQSERLPPGKKRSGPGSQKSYRAALDRLFSSGKIADLVAQKEPDSRVQAADSDNRFRMLDRIKAAQDRDTINQELDTYLEKFELPDDLEIWAKVLEHRSPNRQRQAIEAIDRLLGQEQPKRRRAMIGQLKLIRDVGEDEELVQLASALIKKLE